MSTTALPRLMSSVAIGALPSDPALIDEDMRIDNNYDHLQPCFIDYGCFVRSLVELTSRFRGRARMLELGCASGLLAADVLSQARHVEYRGIDSSPAMAELFARRALSLERPDREVLIGAPVDLRLNSGLHAALRGERADLVVAAQLLQSIPVRSSDVLADRAGMISTARAALKPGGKLVIIEEVFGESLEEHRRFELEWNRLAIRRIVERFFDIRAALHRVDPGLVDVLVALSGRPSLIRVVREQLWRWGEPQLLPLSSWCRFFELLRVRYHAIPHETLKNFYMFVIDA